MGGGAAGAFQAGEMLDYYELNYLKVIGKCIFL